MQLNKIGKDDIQKTEIVRQNMCNIFMQKNYFDLQNCNIY